MLPNIRVIIQTQSRKERIFSAMHGFPLTKREEMNTEPRQLKTCFLYIAFLTHEI